MPTIKIHNTQTGEVIEREMNEIELAQWEKDLAEAELRLKAKAEAEAKKAQAEAQAAANKAAAEAKLAALGLTADDLRALGL